MKNKTYSDKLKDPRWQRVRLEVMTRDDWKCVECKDSESTLHVHHRSYHGEPWEAPMDELETLCDFCHSIVNEDTDSLWGEAMDAITEILEHTESQKKFAFIFRQWARKILDAKLNGKRVSIAMPEVEPTTV